ncbi:MAG: hypothetical protein ABSG43_18900 [Solirubrobacteraceae bacterium]|jgi:hypothetical protein
MISAVKQVIATDHDGAKLSAEQLVGAGVKPGQPAVVEIRPYTAEDWIAEGTGRVFGSDEEEDAFFDRCPANGV